MNCCRHFKSDLCWTPSGRLTLWTKWSSDILTCRRRTWGAWGTRTARLTRRPRFAWGACNATISFLPLMEKKTEPVIRAGHCRLFFPSQLSTGNQLVLWSKCWRRNAVPEVTKLIKSSGQATFETVLDASLYIPIFFFILGYS